MLGRDGEEEQWIGNVWSGFSAGFMYLKQLRSVSGDPATFGNGYYPLSSCTIMEDGFSVSEGERRRMKSMR